MELHQSRHPSSVQLITSRETLVSLIRNIKCLLENLINHGYFSPEDSEIVLQFPTRADQASPITLLLYYLVWAEVIVQGEVDI